MHSCSLYIEWQKRVSQRTLQRSIRNIKVHLYSSCDIIFYFSNNSSYIIKLNIVQLISMIAIAPDNGNMIAASGHFNIFTFFSSESPSKQCSMQNVSIFNQNYISYQFIHHSNIQLKGFTNNLYISARSILNF